MRFGMITDRRISGGSTHLLERRTRQPSDDATGPAMKTSISGYLCRAELIRFSHGLPRSAPLTWSQRGWLARVLGEHVDPSDLAASRHIYVDGLAVEAVLPRLRQLVERFEALRTSFVIDGLEDSVQQVAAEGAFDAVIVELPDARPEQVRRAAAEVEEELRVLAGDFPSDWSTRFALLVHQGSVYSVVFAVSYFTVDNTAAATLSAVLLHLLEHGSFPDARGTDWHPIDQAEYETGPAGRGQSLRSVEYWRESFERGPASMFPVRRAPDAELGFVEFEMQSEALTTALPHIAAAYEVGEPVVMLAATCIALRELTGTDPVRLEIIFNNRWRPELRNAVCNVAQNAVFTIPCDDARFEDFLKLAASQSVRAHRNSHHDPIAVEEARKAVSTAQGKAVERSVFLNHSAPPGNPVDQPYDDAYALGSMLRKTSVEPVGQYSSGGTKFYLGVEREPRLRRYRLFVDTCFITREEAVKTLHRIEQIAVDEARAVRERQTVG